MHVFFTKIVNNLMVFDVHVTVHRDKFLVIKPAIWTNFSNLFLEWNSTCFGQFLCQSSGVFHCTHINVLCHASLLTACSQAVSKPVWHITLLCVQWKIPDDGQKNCPKRVDLYCKNKFEKLLHLICFTVRNVMVKGLTLRLLISYIYIYIYICIWSTYSWWF